MSNFVDLSIFDNDVKFLSERIVFLSGETCEEYGITAETVLLDSENCRIYTMRKDTPAGVFVSSAVHDSWARFCVQAMKHGIDALYDFDVMLTSNDASNCFVCVCPDKDKPEFHFVVLKSGAIFERYASELPLPDVRDVYVTLVDVWTDEPFRETDSGVDGLIFKALLSCPPSALMPEGDGC